MMIRFTIGTNERGTGGRQGIRTLTPRGAHSLAPRPGQPYPATFRHAQSREWTHRESNPDLHHARVVPFRQAMSPIITSA
jgi:hypothetical protein